jgi:alpha-L-arabinofuranosidase
MSVFEKVSNGYDVSNISSAINLTDTIVGNRWYDIRLEVGADTVKCFLNDKLLMTYTEPVKLFSIAGKDDASGDIIVKLVNANDTEVPVSIAVKNAAVLEADAEIISLSAPSLNDENSFESPMKFQPVKSKLPASANGISFPAKPWSINIIRLKQKK